MLDSRRRARDGDALLEVLGRAAVGVGGLHTPELELDASLLHQLREVACCQRRDLVAVEQPERVFRGGRAREVVVDDAVGVAVERTHALSRLQALLFKAQGQALVGLDIVGAAAVVERAGGGGAGAERTEGDAVLWEILDEIGERIGTHAVGAVDHKRGHVGRLGHEAEEGGGKLLVVALFGGLAVRVRGSLGVEALDEVVELGRRLEAGVDGLCAERREAVYDGLDELLARRTCVVADHHRGRGGEVDLEVRDELVERGDELVVVRRIGDLGAEGFPAGLEHLSARIDHLDAVVVLRVVACGDHEADGLALELLAAECTDEADAEACAVEDVGARAQTGSAVGERLVGGLGVRLRCGGDERGGEAVSEVGLSRRDGRG
ncbi:hypothetical protein L1887_48818 [Cichorium endivia]|nr:hypothetical protein L1887_48818 [Cichorium endivia]